MKEFRAHAPSQLGRRYTYRPDLPDQRDHYMKVGAPAPLPDVVDLRKATSPVEDQGNLGSCTANAWVGAIELLDKAADGKFQNWSRLYLYYNERALHGNQAQDSGAFIRDGAMALAKQGICLESHWKYEVAKFATKPPVSCYAEGLNHQALQYSRVSQTEVEVCTALAQGHPVVLGFTVYQSFESAAVAKSGMVPMPGPKEKTLGGHAVLAVGYNRPKRLFTIRNSWGAAWGDKGHCYFPFDYLLNPNLAQDFWIIQTLENLSVGQHTGQTVG
jgi:C1A family cysteine protease